MAIEKLTKDLNIIQKLDDEPNDVGGLTSAELKAEFDKAGNEIKEYINSTVVPAVNSVQTQADASTADQHTHSNKALLDTYDQTNADIKDAIAKEHTHGNKDVLDSITADQQTVLASIKGVTQTLGNATDKVPSEAAVAAAMSANGNIPAGGTTGQVLKKKSDTALDVEWGSVTAADVGARPDTWMPTAADVGAVGDVVRVTTAGTDLDDYTTTGLYYFSNKHTPTNAPAGVNGWLMVLQGDQGTVAKQIWYRHGTANSNDSQTFVRTQTSLNSTNWSSWKRFYTDDMITASTTDITAGTSSLATGSIYLVYE